MFSQLGISDKRRYITWSKPGTAWKIVLPNGQPNYQYTWGIVTTEPKLSFGQPGAVNSRGGGGGGGGGGGALRVKISRGARLKVQNGTQQDLNAIIDLVNFGGKKIVYMLKMGGFEMGPNKIWIKW